MSSSSGFGQGANMIVLPPWCSGMSSAYPMPCQSSSEMKGKKGWNRRRVCERTKSRTASLFTRRFSSCSGEYEEVDDPSDFWLKMALLASTYQSQYSLQKKR